MQRPYRIRVQIDLWPAQKVVMLSFAGAIKIIMSATLVPTASSVSNAACKFGFQCIHGNSLNNDYFKSGSFSI